MKKSLILAAPLCALFSMNSNADRNYVNEMLSTEFMGRANSVSIKHFTIPPATVTTSEETTSTEPQSTTEPTEVEES